MIQKLGAPLIFTAFFVESKVGKTGLTVTVDVQERANGGVATLIVTGGSATDAGGGFYDYELSAASVDANGMYRAVFKTATTTVDAQHIPSAWLTPSWLTTLGAATITFASPMAADGTLTLTRGDDYLNADGLAVPFSASGLPSLIGGAIKLTFRAGGRGPLVYTGTIDSATTAHFDLTAAQTGLLEVGSPAYRYDVQITFASGHIYTPQRGDVYVNQDVTP